MKLLIALFLLLILLTAQAQRLPDRLYSSTINAVKLFQENNQFSQPIIHLNSADQLELHFDDLVDYPQNYFYSYELCNSDWTPANVNAFDMCTIRHCYLNEIQFRF